MPFVNGKYYMNPRHGAAMERARQEDEGKFGRILAVIADVFRGLSDSSDEHTRFPKAGDGNSGPMSPPKAEYPWSRPPGPYSGPPQFVPEPYDPNDPQGLLPKHRPATEPPIRENGVRQDSEARDSSQQVQERSQGAGDGH